MPQTTQTARPAPQAAGIALTAIGGATTITAYLGKRMRISNPPLTKVGVLLQSKVHSGARERGVA